MIGEKLWLDDIRKPPEGFWVWARTIEDAKMIVLASDTFMEMSLDHDMGLQDHDPDLPEADNMRLPRRYKCRNCLLINLEPGLNLRPVRCEDCGSEDFEEIHIPDGLDFVRWLCYEAPREKIPKTITIHSMNNVCAMRMAIILKDWTHVIVKPFHRWYKE